MMSRNEQKMKDKAKEIQDAIPERQIKFRYIVSDLTSVNDCAKFRTLIEENI